MRSTPTRARVSSAGVKVKVLSEILNASNSVDFRNDAATPRFQSPRLLAKATPPVPDSPEPYDDVGKSRKSLPICPAASACPSGIVYCPVGMLAPTVNTTASLPSVRLARTCVSVSPLIELDVEPLLDTSELAYAVATSMLKRDVRGSTNTIGTESCVTVLADAPVPILMDTYCGIAARAASLRPCASATHGAAANSSEAKVERISRMLTASG